MEAVDVLLKRPLPCIEPSNMLSQEYLDTLKLQVKKKKTNFINYLTEEVEDFIVESALEIKRPVLEHIVYDCIKRNRKVNAVIEGTMSVGKTLLQKWLNVEIHKDMNDVVIIHMSGSNTLNYKIYYDNELLDNEGNVIKTIKFSKFFRGNDKEKVDFDKLEDDSVVTNFNNFGKLIDLVESQNKRYLILFDECHAYLSEYFFRNSEIEDAIGMDYNGVMEQFEKAINYSLSPLSKSLGMLWFTATPDVFDCDDRMCFTRVFRVDLKDEYKMPISLMKPVHLKGNKLISKLNYIIDWIKENPSDSVLSIYLNNAREIKNIVNYLKTYIKNFRPDLSVEDIEKMIAVLYKDNSKDNEVLEQIEKNSTIPDEVRIIFATAFVNSGLEIRIKDRALDVILFIDRNTFSLIGEIQFTGRFRNGIRILHVLSYDLYEREMISYQKFLIEKIEHLRELATAIINVIEMYAKVNKCSLKEAKKVVKITDIKSGIHCISIRNNRCVINETAVRNCAFLIYQQEYTLSSYQTLTDAFYNHKTMNIKNVSVLEVKDYTETTLESLGLEKIKREKTNSVKVTRQAINNLNKLITDENKSYVRAVLRKNDIRYMDYQVEVEEDNGETSILVVDTTNIKKELNIILNSNRYKKASALFKNDENYNETIIDKILDLKVKNTEFTNKLKDQEVLTINVMVNEAPIQEQEKVKKDIKKVLQEADFIIKSKEALLNIISPEEKINGKRITEKLKTELFELLMYADVVESEFSKTLNKLNEDDEKINLLKVQWNPDGTPATKYDKNNKYHNKLILKVFKLYFTVKKDKNSYRLSSMKDSYKI